MITFHIVYKDHPSDSIAKGINIDAPNFIVAGIQFTTDHPNATFIIMYPLGIPKFINTNPTEHIS